MLLFYLPWDGSALFTSFFSPMGSFTVVVTDCTLALVGGLQSVVTARQLCLIRGQRCGLCTCAYVYVCVSACICMCECLGVHLCTCVLIRVFTCMYRYV